MRLLSLCLLVLTAGCAATARPFRPPTTPTHLHYFTGSVILLPAHFTATHDLIAREDTLQFRYALSSAAAGANWQCGSTDAIVHFTDNRRASGAMAYWSTVPEGTRFHIIDILQTTDRWLCLEVEPLKMQRAQTP